MEIGGDFFDVQVVGGLYAGEHRDGGQFRAEIKADKRRVVNADGAVGDEFVGGTSDVEIGVQRAALKRSTFGKIDAESRKKVFDVLCGHVLAFELDVDLGGFASGFVGAAEMSSGAADFQSGRFEDARVFDQTVFGIEIHGERNARRRTTSNEQGFGKFGGALRFGFAAFRFNRPIEIEKAPESQGGIEETRRGEIQRADIELGAERCQRSVGPIDRTDGAIELELAAGREIGGDRDRKLRGHGNVGGGYVDMVVVVALLRIRGANDDTAVLELKFPDGKVRGRV